MPVICARYVSPEQKRAAKQAYHHDECAPVEEAAVYVRNEADRERAHCSRDVALVAEARAGEVVRHPTNARNGNEKVLGKARQRQTYWGRTEVNLQALVGSKGRDSANSGRARTSGR